MTKTFRNSILPGFYPTLSTCHADEDCYLVSSTFEDFSGMLVFHGRDLVHWQQVGHVLDRPSQLDLDGPTILQGLSGGLISPTIRYRDNTFFCLKVEAHGQGHDFHIADTPKCWQPVTEDIDGRISVRR